MKTPVRILVSGPGLIGRKHIALLQEKPDTVIPAIVAPDHEHNVKFAAEHGLKLHFDLEEALRCEQADGVIISSPNAFHCEQASICVAHGVPSLVEKPLTDSLADAALLTQRSEASGVPVLVGHHRTYSPLLEVAREYIQSDEFGDPVCLQGSALFYKPADYYVAGPWRTRKGGGPILINMIHEVGIMRFLFGEITSVSARLSHKTRGFEVEDTAAIALTFANGALGTFLLSDTAASSKSWEMTAGENPAYPFFPNQDCYHFAGSVGSLDFPSMQTRTYRGEPDRSWWLAFTEGRRSLARRDPLATQIDHFVDVIRGQAAPRVSARDGMLNMVVLEAIVRSAELGRDVAIAEIAA